jgi:hypothetical protein
MSQQHDERLQALQVSINDVHIAVRQVPRLIGHPTDRILMNMAGIVDTSGLVIPFNIELCSTYKVRLTDSPAK